MGWAAEGPDPARGLPGPQPRAAGSSPGRPAVGLSKAQRLPAAEHPLPAREGGRRGRAHRGPPWPTAACSAAAFPAALEAQEGTRPPERSANPQPGGGGAGRGQRPSPPEGARGPRTWSLPLLGRAGDVPHLGLRAAPGSRVRDPHPDGSQVPPNASISAVCGRKPRPQCPGPQGWTPRSAAKHRAARTSDCGWIEAPLGPEGFLASAGSQSMSPQGAGCRPSRRRLGSVRCKYQRDRKMDSIRRAPRSRKDSS